MTVSDQIRNAALSYARVFAAAALAVYIATGRAVLDLTGADLEAMLSAGLAALALTAANALRPGENKFGVGADADA